MRVYVPVVAGALLASVIVANAPARAVDVLSIEAIFSDEGHVRTPTEIAWTEDGERVSFLWSKQGARDLWTMAPATDREPAVLLRAGELKDGDREIPYKDYAWSPDGAAILFQAAGDLYLYRLADHVLERLTSSEARSEDPRFAPDSSRVAFVRSADLWIVDVVTGKERRLTEDGKEGHVLNGKPDWVYWEEIWHRDSVGFWWSPDSRRIAYMRFDEEGVPTHPLVHDEERDPRVENQPYPKPGDRNPKVTVGVRDLGSGTTTWMKTGIEEGADYIARVRFTRAGDRLAVITLDREQAAADLLLCDPSSGECETVLRERLPTWVDVGNDWEVLADGRVLWGSDRDGWRRLYLHARDGEPLRAVSPAGIAVTKLDRFVEETGTVFFTGFRSGGLGAKDRQLYRVSLRGGEAELLAPGCQEVQQRRGDARSACEPARGTASASVAPTGRAWIVTHSTASAPPRATLVGGPGATPIALPHQPPTAYDLDALPRWEFVTIDGPGGAPLPARIMKPLDFDPRRRHPVIMFQYGGPASQMVEDSSERPLRQLWHARQAQRGYVVVESDNPASNFFGKQGADRLHRRFGELELASQLAVAAHLKAQPWVDPDRVGLWGWSGGGANTLYAVFQSPGTWRAAVAGAPVTDWRLYDSIWTERYLDSPASNEAGYRDSSAITWASKLADRLLVVHGTGDDNVHAQNTFALVRELVKAKRPFEQAIYPGEKHAFSDGANRHFYERMEEFFDRELRSR